jgi:plastocyanin
MITVILAALVLTGCTGEVTNGPATTPVPRVIDVKIVDTDDYQGPIPMTLSATAGEVIELRVTNEDHNFRTFGITSNFHPIVVKGPGVNTGMLELRPDQTKSIIFEVEIGTYTFSCGNGGCDIHLRVSGVIEVIQ